MNHTIVIENYSTVHLRGHFNIPDVSMSPLFMDELSEGIFGEPMSKYDNILTEEIRNHLNESLGVSHSGMIYCTRAILSHGFYIFHPIFEEHSFFFAFQKLSNLFTTFTMQNLTSLFTFIILKVSGLFTFTMKKLSRLFTLASFF